jgi:hypothetical protein
MIPKKVEPKENQTLCPDCSAPIDPDLGCDLCVTKPHDIGKWDEPGLHEDYHVTGGNDWGVLPQADPPGTKGWCQSENLRDAGLAGDVHPEFDDAQRKATVVLWLKRRLYEITEP